MQSLTTLFIRENPKIEPRDLYEKIADLGLGFLRTAIGFKKVRVGIFPHNNISFN